MRTDDDQIGSSSIDPRPECGDRTPESTPHRPVFDILRLVLPRLPAALASTRARNRIETIAGSLPFLTTGGFECRLERGDDIVDFHAALPPHRDHIRWPDTHPVWQLLNAVSSGNSDSGSPMCGKITEMVLEFDLHRDVRGDEVPNVFLSLVPEAGQDEAAIRAVTRFLSESAAGVPLARLLASLPDAGRVAQIGVMHRDGDSLVRLNVADLRPHVVLAVLHRFAPRVERAAAEVLGPMEPLLDWVQLSVDLSGETGRVGLECFLSAQPSYEPRWRQMIDLLRDWGACDEEKGRALLAWPGLIRREKSTAWPAAFMFADRFMAAEASSLFVCRINHIKVTAALDRAPRAKAYLSFNHQWLDRGGGALAHSTSPSRS